MSIPLLFINSITVSPYFVPTKHLTLIGDCFLSYWIVLLATTATSRKLQLPNYRGTPEFVGTVSINIHVYVFNERFSQNRHILRTFTALRLSNTCSSVELLLRPKKIVTIERGQDFVVELCLHNRIAFVQIVY